MPVSGIGSYDPTLGTQTNAVSDRTNLKMDDFIQLFAAQLRYQDMSSPMSNAEMMEQMTQMSTVAGMTTLTNQMKSMYDVSVTTYGASFLGKQVTVVDKIDPETGDITKSSGVVTGVSFYEGQPVLYVNGNKYALGQMMSIGEVPEEPDKNPDNDPDNPSTDTGNTNTTS